MLQEGGVQEAMIVAPPGLTELVEPVVAVKAAAFEELQVSGTLVISTPSVSITVAVMAFDPLVSVNVLPPPPLNSSAIDCTGHTVKLNVWLVTLLFVAKISVTPGFVVVTRAWFARRPLPVELTLTTPPVVVCQLNGPTVPVMSRPGGGPPRRL
jgi:hypothetical protein